MVPFRKKILLFSNNNNISTIIETLTLNNKRTILAQYFIPDIKKGDKRILIVNYQTILYGISRIPKIGETRGNLAIGGIGHVNTLTNREFWICRQIKKTLQIAKLSFVGIDIIGEYLTEINITSPTCIRELDYACNLNIAKKIIRLN